jgi:hypothetical protein
MSSASGRPWRSVAELSLDRPDEVGAERLEVRNV